MKTNKKNILLTAGIATAVLISLNSFLLVGADKVDTGSPAYYDTKDSLVNAIKTFDLFSDKYLDVLTQMDQNTSYMYVGETNLLRSKINNHQADLTALFTQWQQSSSITWAEDSTEFMTHFGGISKEMDELQNRTLYFLESH